MAGARDVDLAETRVDQISVYARIGVNWDALGSEALGDGDARNLTGKERGSG
jgi:hypothetical protein